MAKKVKILSGIIMSAVMALMLSAFFTITKMGFVPGWQREWAVSFISAWPIALVLSMLIARPVRAVSIRLLKQAS